jgi:hypothetical protein
MHVHRIRSGPITGTAERVSCQISDYEWRGQKLTTDNYNPKNGLFLFQTSQTMERIQSPIVAE